MKQIYNIADIKISIDDPFEIDNYSRGNDFQIDESSADFSFTFEHKKDISEILNGYKIVYKTLYYFILNREDFFVKAFHHERNIYALTVFDEKEKKGVCYYSDFQIMSYKIKHGFTSMMYLELERVFLEFSTLVLHSSYISWRQRAILFSAPSGTGKSTQANLWKNYENAEIINGDRTAIRRINNTWFACGIPMCGTSNICKKISTPLAVVVIIRQAQENEVIELNSLEVFKLLYSEITINRWNQFFVEKIMNLVQKMVEEVTVIQLNCTKEKEAVDVLKKYLLERQIV